MPGAKRRAVFEEQEAVLQAQSNGHSRGSFVSILLQILDDGPTDVVSWSNGGTAFCIYDCDRFTEILKRHFKSSSFTSFCRQLSYWGWSKIPQKKLADADVTPLTIGAASASRGGGSGAKGKGGDSAKGGKKKGSTSARRSGRRGKGDDGEDEDVDEDDVGEDDDYGGDDGHTGGSSSSAAASSAIASGNSLNPSVFTNPLFIRGRPDLIAQIKRKTNHDFKQQVQQTRSPEEILREQNAALKQQNSQLLSNNAALTSKLGAAILLLRQSGVPIPPELEGQGHHLLAGGAGKPKGSRGGVSPSPLLASGAAAGSSSSSSSSLGAFGASISDSVFSPDGQNNGSGLRRGSRRSGAGGAQQQDMMYQQNGYGDAGAGEEDDDEAAGQFLEGADGGVGAAAAWEGGYQDAAGDDGEEGDEGDVDGLPQSSPASAPSAPGSTQRVRRLTIRPSSPEAEDGDGGYYYQGSTGGGGAGGGPESVNTTGAMTFDYNGLPQVQSSAGDHPSASNASPETGSRSAASGKTGSSTNGAGAALVAALSGSSHSKMSSTGDDEGSGPADGGNRPSNGDGGDEGEDEEDEGNGDAANDEPLATLSNPSNAYSRPYITHSKRLNANGKRGRNALEDNNSSSALQQQQQTQRGGQEQPSAAKKPRLDGLSDPSNGASAVPAKSEGSNGDDLAGHLTIPPSSLSEGRPTGGGNKSLQHPSGSSSSSSSSSSSASNVIGFTSDTNTKGSFDSTTSTTSSSNRVRGGSNPNDEAAAARGKGKSGAPPPSASPVGSGERPATSTAPISEVVGALLNLFGNEPGSAGAGGNGGSKSGAGAGGKPPPAAPTGSMASLLGLDGGPSSLTSSSSRSPKDDTGLPLGAGTNGQRQALKGKQHGKVGGGSNKGSGASGLLAPPHHPQALPPSLAPLPFFQQHPYQGHFQQHHPLQQQQQLSMGDISQAQQTFMFLQASMMTSPLAAAGLAGSGLHVGGGSGSGGGENGGMAGLPPMFNAKAAAAAAGLGHLGVFHQGGIMTPAGSGGQQSIYSSRDFVGLAGGYMPQFLPAGVAGQGMPMGLVAGPSTASNTGSGSSTITGGTEAPSTSSASSGSGSAAAATTAGSSSLFSPAGNHGSGGPNGMMMILPSQQYQHHHHQMQALQLQNLQFQLQQQQQQQNGSQQQGQQGQSSSAFRGVFSPSMSTYMGMGMRPLSGAPAAGTPMANGLGSVRLVGDGRSLSGQAAGAAMHQHHYPQPLSLLSTARDWIDAAALSAALAPPPAALQQAAALAASASASASAPTTAAAPPPAQPAVPSSTDAAKEPPGPPLKPEVVVA